MGDGILYQHVTVALEKEIHVLKARCFCPDWMDFMPQNSMCL